MELWERAAASAADARVSGQGGLFGGGDSNVVPIRMPVAATWSLAQRMAAEKESFGFYFSAHPVDRYRHLAEAHGAKSYTALASLPAPPDGGRTGAVMAGMVEEARPRTSARGRRYLMATMSDSSGQFVATIFDDDASAQVEAAAKSGACALLNVELDRRPGEEAPRVTIRSLQLFESLFEARPAPLEVRTWTTPAHRQAAGVDGRGARRQRRASPQGEAEPGEVGCWYWPRLHSTRNSPRASNGSRESFRRLSVARNHGLRSSPERID